MRIKLTQGFYAIVDNSDFDWLNSFKWCYIQGYARKRIPGMNRTIGMHELITHKPKGKEVDHINGDKLDNRRCNLRVCSKSENMINVSVHRDNLSGYKGVTFRKKLYELTGIKHYMARVSYKGKQFHVGSFKNPIHAAMARDICAKDNLGEYVNLNFPKGLHG